MDESRQTGAAVGVGSGGGAGALPGALRPGGGPWRARTKLAVVVVGTVVVLAGLSAGGYWAWHRYIGNGSDDGGLNGAGHAVAPSTYNADQKAQYYLGQKNYPAAEAIYTNELKTAQTAADKAQIYISLATVRLDMNDYARAYQYALQAEALAHSYQTASLAAYAAQQNGDKPDAAKYYQLAIDRLDKNMAGYNYVLSGLQASLKEVSG